MIRTRAMLALSVVALIAAGASLAVAGPTSKLPHWSGATYQWFWEGDLEDIDGFVLRWRHVGELEWHEGKYWSPPEKRYITRMPCKAIDGERLCPGIDFDMKIAPWVHPACAVACEIEFQVTGYRIEDGEVRREEWGDWLTRLEIEPQP